MGKMNEEKSMTTKSLDREIQNINLRLTEYIDVEFYLPLKEELTGVSHSLGFKKEMLKDKIERELNDLKKKLKDLD